jgi:hypothetical protein
MATSVQESARVSKCHLVVVDSASLVGHRRPGRAVGKGWVKEYSLSHQVS